MAKVEDIVFEELEKFNESIRFTLNERGMDTTGNARNSLEVNRFGNTYLSRGIHYIEYLNRGRPPGLMPPIDVIMEWVNIKGLEIDPWAVAKKIARDGTRIYQNRELGLKLEDKVEQLEQNLNERLPEFLSNEIKTQINKAFTK